MSLADLATGSLPVQSVRTCWCIIYMFVCSPTSCLGVVNVDIDQNHQLWWSPPGSTINEVSTCQLNLGQREEEGNVCINMSASSQRGLGSGLTPGLTALPDHKATKRQTWLYLLAKRTLKSDWVSLFFSDFLFSGQLAGECRNIWTEWERVQVSSVANRLMTDKVRLAVRWKCGLMPSHVPRVRGM